MTAKRIVCLLCALLLALLAVGCGSGTNQKDTEAVAAAVDKFRACGSFSMVQTTEIEETLTVDELSYSYTGYTETQIQLITGPAFTMKTAVKGFQEYDGEQSESSYTSYVVTDSDGYSEYFTDGSEWYKVSMGSEGAVYLEGFNAASVVDTFFTDMLDFGKASTDNINGVSAVCYEGRLSGENLVSMLDANGLLSSISSMSENQQTKIRSNLVKDLESAVVSVWVDSQSGYPIRFEIRLAQVLNSLNDSISKTLGSISTDQQYVTDKYDISMNLSDFDTLTEIRLPPETANALPYEG